MEALDSGSLQQGSASGREIQDGGDAGARSNQVERDLVSEHFPEDLSQRYKETGWQ